MSLIASSSPRTGIQWISTRHAVVQNSHWRLLFQFPDGDSVDFYGIIAGHKFGAALAAFSPLTEGSTSEMTDYVLA